ncbi:MAG: TonB-dependent receptor [Steroidobacteraceae bacterium]
MRCRSRSRRLLLCALVMISHTVQAAAPPYKGRPLAQLLRELATPEVQFLFSSELLPDRLLVEEEPSSPPGTGTLGLARTLLAGHDLALERVGQGLYAVIRAAPPAAARLPPVALDELVVTASRYRFEAADTAAVGILAADQLADQPGIGEDPLRAMARIPGVVLDGLSAMSHVRGGEGSEVLMLLDGFALRRPFHMAGYQSPFSVVDAQLLASADVYTGGFPARYGNRMSAVYDLHTLEGRSAPHNQLGIDFFNAGGYTTGHLQSADLDYLAAGRIGTLSPLLQAFAPSVGNPRYADVLLRAQRTIATGLALSANLLWARDELDISDRRRDEDATIEDRVRYIWLQAHQSFGETWEAQMWLGQTVIDSLREGTVDNPGIASGAVSDRRAATLWDLRSLVAWQPDQQRRLEFGGEYTHESANYRYASSAFFTAPVRQLFSLPAERQRQTRIQPQRDRAAVFGSWRWRLTDAVTTETGMRAQLLAQPGQAIRMYVEPRLGIRWEPRRGTQLHFNWGRYHQADEVQEIDVGDGLVDFPRTQRSEHFIVGWRQHLTDALSLRLEAYSKQQAQPRERFENLFNRRTILPEIAPDRIAIQPQYAELRGVELSLDHSWRGWQSWFTAQHASAEDESDGHSVARSWDLGWGFNAGTSRRTGPWQFTASLNLHRGFPTTQLLDADGVAVLGTRNAIHLERFLELNLRMDYEKPLARGILRYSVELQNALAQPNECCTDLVADGTSLRLRRLHGLPLLPSLGVRWSW